MSEDEFRILQGELEKRIAKIIEIPSDKFGKVFTLKDFLEVIDEFRRDVLEKAKTSLWIYNEAYYSSWDKEKNEKWVPESVVLKWLGDKK